MHGGLVRSAQCHLSAGDVQSARKSIATMAPSLQSAPSSIMTDAGKLELATKPFAPLSSTSLRAVAHSDALKRSDPSAKLLMGRHWTVSGLRLPTLLQVATFMFWVVSSQFQAPLTPVESLKFTDSVRSGQSSALIGSRETRSAAIEEVVLSVSKSKMRAFIAHLIRIATDVVSAGEYGEKKRDYRRCPVVP